MELKNDPRTKYVTAYLDSLAKLSQTLDMIQKLANSVSELQQEMSRSYYAAIDAIEDNREPRQTVN